MNRFRSIILVAIIATIVLAYQFPSIEAKTRKTLTRHFKSSNGHVSLSLTDTKRHVPGKKSFAFLYLASLPKGEVPFSGPSKKTHAFAQNRVLSSQSDAV